MTEATDIPDTENVHHTEPGGTRRRRSERDVDVAGRNLVELGRAAAASGDAGAARALLTGAVGSEDPAVAGEAANALGTAEALAEVALSSSRRRRRREG